MAFSGNLKEFELPEIFQLLQQQEKSGIFNLYDDNGDPFGSVIFDNGMIIGASQRGASVQTFTARYLVDVKKYPRDEIMELISAFADNHPQSFFSELVDRRYLTREEAASLARNSIEDLSCDLFRSAEGSYRFDPDPNAAGFAIEAVSLSAEAVSMEAMRRLDEWKRMSSYFDEDTIFKLADEQFPNTIMRDTTRIMISMLNDPVRAILPHINGTASVAEIAESCSFFSEYRVHETIFEMLSASIVVPSGRRASGHRKKQSKYHVEEARRTERMSIALLVTSLAIFLSFFLGFIVLRHMTLAHIREQSSRAAHTMEYHLGTRKYFAARLNYRAVHGTMAPDRHTLALKGFIHPRDLGIIQHD